MTNRTFRALIATVGLWLAALFFAGSAAAQSGQLCNGCIPFDFNYAQGGVGSSVTNIGQLNFTDPTLIVQNFSGGLPTGAFSDTGAFQFISYNPFLGGTTLGVSNSLPNVVQSSSATAPNTNLFAFYSLSGNTTTAGGITTITFTPGAGTITLYEGASNSTLSSTSSQVPSPGSATAIATFKLLSGSAVGTFGVAGLGVQSFAFTLEQIGGANNLFTTVGGQNLFNGLFANAFEVGSANISSNVIAFGACSATQLTAAPAGGGNFECATPTSQGDIQLRAVPEPASLLLFGVGLLAIGGALRYRKRTDA